MNPISLDDPMFFQKVNAIAPEKFDQKQMEKLIEEEKVKATPLNQTKDEKEE